MGIRRVRDIRYPASYITGVQRPWGKSLTRASDFTLKDAEALFRVSVKLFLRKMVMELLWKRTPVRRPPKTNWSHSGRPNRRLGADMDKDALLTFCLSTSVCSCIIFHPPSSSLWGTSALGIAPLGELVGPQLCRKIPYAAVLTQVILLSRIPSPHICHDNFIYDG